MDQVTLIGPNDTQSLKLHIAATHKNNHLVERTFYIYAETSELQKLIESHKYEDIIFIPESTLLDSSICRNKWIYQQLLKLSVDQLRSSHNLSELFLFTDVDTIAVKSIKEDLFFRDGLPIYYTKSRHSNPILCKDFQTAKQENIETQQYLNWHYAMTWSTTQLLGIQKVSELAAIDACVIWSQKTLKRLKRHIEKTNSLPWQHAILKLWNLFLCHHQQHFIQESGFREIAFSNEPQEDIIALETLQKKIRLGFSEWQLYTYFNTYIEKSDKRWLGLMGNANAPHVAEFNENALNQQQLSEILKAQDSTPFLYFYPSIDQSEKTLFDYLTLNTH